MSAKLLKKTYSEELAGTCWQKAFIKRALYKDPLGADTAATKGKSLRNWDLLGEAQRSTSLEQVMLTFGTSSSRVVDPRLRQRKRISVTVFLMSRPFF